ncbi:hypothetical protein ACLGIH_33165 [Streptomyces sp. HMX87]|uniref:hypothetical protein n=1 Tax=Streptomyces sp. HMX87 TaxID=3390849 RepID=UPI003A899752
MNGQSKMHQPHGECVHREFGAADAQDDGTAGAVQSIDELFGLFLVGACEQGVDLAQDRAPGGGEGTVDAHGQGCRRGGRVARIHHDR